MVAAPSDSRSGDPRVAAGDPRRESRIPRRCSRPRTRGCSRSASASRCRAGRGAVPRRSRSTSAAPRAAARGRAVRHRPRARAVRAERGVGGAAPLALAQRRHLPRARRARALDSGRAHARRDVLRPHRRAHGEQRGHGRAAGALLSRGLRAGPPRRRRRRAGAGPAARGPDPDRSRAEEERGALRLFLRALRRLPAGPRLGGRDLVRRAHRPARAGQQASARAAAPRRAAGRRAGGVHRGRRHRLPRLRRACGRRRGSAREALAAGAVPVVSDLELYRELVGDGERGLLFPLGDALDARGPARAARRRRRPARRARRGAAGSGEARAAGPRSPTRSRRSTGASVARRHDPAGDPRSRKRLEGRGYIHCDLHMHTDHSPDCATPVEVLLETAKERGLGAIAITDHNEVSGALEAREIADEIGGIKVIVAEEVKTAHQGEVIGLFIEEKIERGMSLAETIAEIRAAGRPRLRPPSVRPAALGPRLRAPAGGRRRDRHPRGLQPADRRSLASTRRRSASRASTGSSPAPAPTATSPRASAA